MGIRSTLPLQSSHRNLPNRLGQVDIPQDRLDVKKQWVRLIMFLVVILFEFLKLLFFSFFVAIFALAHDMEAIHCLW